MSRASEKEQMSSLPLPWGNSSFQGDGLVSADLHRRLVSKLDEAQQQKVKKAEKTERDEDQAEAEGQGGGEKISPTSNTKPTGALEHIEVEEKPVEEDSDTSSLPYGAARRLVERLNFSDEALASELAEALKPILPSQLSVDCVSGTCSRVNGQDSTAVVVAPSATYDSHMGPMGGGEWELAGVDSCIQLFRYPVGGIFTKHRDGPKYYSADVRTFFTVLIYLNDGYEGGRTMVFSDDGRQELAVEPKSGRCFVMLQRTLHQGSEVTKGIKDALRCDVLYRRREPTEATEEQPEVVVPCPTAAESIAHLAKRDKALHWRELGYQLESSGQLDDAVRVYQRATKLVPEIMEAE